jgi:hypothetical protein
MEKKNDFIDQHKTGSQKMEFLKKDTIMDRKKVIVLKEIPFLNILVSYAVH